jgi:hypothetical protein
MQQQPPLPTQLLPTQLQYMGCPDISSHILNCPLCTKLYRNDNSRLIMIIVLLALFVMYLMTKLTK